MNQIRKSGRKVTRRSRSNPQASSYEWCVENWQIPVPIGDASAHFLLKISSDGALKIENAFFMDGGDDGNKKTAWEQIRKALEKMDKVYGDKWKFDAIVITHHDSDHYKGLSQFLGEPGARYSRRSNNLKQYFKTDYTVYSGGKHPDNIKWNIANLPGSILGEDGIGIDIFSRTRIFPSRKKTTDSDNACRVEQLDWQKIKVAEMRPRFVIVGANGYGPKNYKGYKRPGKITMNQTSILAVLYWPSNEGRTSYYTGGDGNPRVATEVVIPWMKRNGTRNKKYQNKPGSAVLPCLPVDMMKLDHHGSLKENLIEDYYDDAGKAPIFQFEPIQVLVTPGFQHGHPNWVILEMVKKYFESIETFSDRGTPQLFTTRSPYWIAKKLPGQIDTNTNHATHGKSKSMLDLDLGADPLKLSQAAADEVLYYSELFCDELRHAEDLRARRIALITAHKNAKVLQRSRTKSGIGHRTLNEGGEKNSRIAIKEIRKAYMSEDRRETEEPELTDFMILNQQLADLRRVIIDNAKHTWAKISPQPLCRPKAPFFLLRFAITQNDRLPRVEYNINEDGNIKPSEDMELEEDSVELFGSEDSQEDENFQTEIKNAQANSDEQTVARLQRYKVVRDGRDTIWKYIVVVRGKEVVRRLVFPNEALRRLNYVYDTLRLEPVLQYAHTNTLGKAQVNSNGSRGNRGVAKETQSSKSKLKRSELTNSLHAGIANPKTIDLHSLRGEHITNPITREETSFNCDAASLLSFKEFKRQYAPNFLKDVNLQKTKLTNEKWDAARKSLKQQWQDLVILADNLAVLQYQRMRKNAPLTKSQQKNRWNQLMKQEFSSSDSEYSANSELTVRPAKKDSPMRTRSKANGTPNDENTKYLEKQEKKNKSQKYLKV